MKAISTRYVGPTNTRGARIVADDGDGNRVSVSFDYGAPNPHIVAAYALAEKMKLVGLLIEGFTKTGRVYVWDSGDKFHVVSSDEPRAPRVTAKRNGEDLTYREWLNAAHMGEMARSPESFTAWERGEDPTEYRS